MLSETSQTEENKHRMVSHICGTKKKKAKIVKTESKMVVTRGGGRWEIG